jgi:hypothetical protein
MASSGQPSRKCWAVRNDSYVSRHVQQRIAGKSRLFFPHAWLFSSFRRRFAHARRPIKHVSVECFEKCAAISVARLPDEALVENFCPLAKFPDIIAYGRVCRSPCHRYIVPSFFFLPRTEQLKTRAVVRGAIQSENFTRHQRSVMIQFLDGSGSLGELKEAPSGSS